ncbi:MAG: hypothetical protein V1678_03365 [Candidatus Aenigmatarchaeota archaeon]
MDKNFVIGTAMVVVMTAAILSATEVATTPGDSSISAMYHTAVCVYKNGELTGPCESNNVTNAGLNWTRDVLGNAAGVGKVQYIALGNTTNGELITLTSLPGQINDCGLAINAQAPTYAVVTGSNGNWSTTNLWTSTCNSEIVNTTALYNISAPGTSCTATNCTMFAGKNFTSVTLQSGDQLNITWYVWVTNVP